VARRPVFPPPPSRTFPTVPTRFPWAQVERILQLNRREAVSHDAAAAAARAAARRQASAHSAAAAARRAEEQEAEAEARERSAAGAGSDAGDATVEEVTLSAELRPVKRLKRVRMQVSLPLPFVLS